MANATLYRMVTDEHVCPYGLKARNLLRWHGFELDDRPLRSRAETDAFKQQHGVETTPQIFIEGDRVGGYDALRKHLGVAREGTTYAPVVAVFASTALAALVLAGPIDGELRVGPALARFVALSMVVLAVLKLRDLEAFSLQFVGYDLLARRGVGYAYAYPFLELGAGLLMLGGLLPWLAGPIAVLIGLEGAASIVKAVQIDGRELKCACVGGNSRVPLGLVSFTESAMMVAMGAWTLVRGV